MNSVLLAQQAPYVFAHVGIVIGQYNEFSFRPDSGQVRLRKAIAQRRKLRDNAPLLSTRAGLLRQPLQCLFDVSLCTNGGRHLRARTFNTVFGKMLFAAGD